MRPLTPLVPLAVALALTSAGCAEGPPGALEELLGVLPSAAAERTVFYTHLEADEGFGSALPLGQLGDLLGVEPARLTDVLETGGVPLTVLAGVVRPQEVTAAAAASGYATSEEGEWVTFARDDGPGSALPLATAVPAGAARDGVLVLGSAGEVRSVVDGASPVGGAPGVGAIVERAGGAHALALLTGPEPIVEAAQAHGGVEAALARGDVSGALPAWAAAALVWGQPDDESFDGAVLVAYDTAVDGDEVARALVLRAATSPLLAEGRRSTADLFERGGPRWDADLGVARLPVRWRVGSPGDVRADVEAGALLFLAPADA